MENIMNVIFDLVSIVVALSALLVYSYWLGLCG